MISTVLVEDDAPRFWADQGCENVPRMTLAVDRLREYTPGGYLALEELVRLADSLRSLQRTDASFISEPLARALVEESARLLEDTAGQLKNQHAARRMRRHAAHLRAGTWQEPGIEQAAAETDGLVVLCGPLTTWGSKSRHYLHSAVVAVEDEEESQAFAQLDQTLPELARYYQEILGVGPLRLDETLASYTVTDLALCGGEANGTPKHFAYFLPEDVGCQSSSVNKTVVFRNVYIERLRLVSIPLYRLFHAHLDPFLARRAAGQDVALRWFRAHDVGHSWRLGPDDGDQALARLGPFRAGGLDEALADTLGYLALVGPWAPAGERSEEVAATFFMSEMLRYASRWDDIHCDALAARLTFNYLVRHRHLEINDDGTELVADPHELTAGILALCRRLIRAVRGNDAVAVQELAVSLDLCHADARIEAAIARAACSNNDIRY